MGVWVKLGWLFLSVALLVGATSGAFASSAETYTGFLSSLGAGGYDVVAYFKDGKAVEGKQEFATSFKGATWRFSSKADLDAFRNNPTAYAPQYGGYCAWAVSQNKTAAGDPNVWRIVNGKLYFNYNKDVQAKWNADVANLIAKGDHNWPSVLGK
jgi:YHS domain-containing protein